MSNELKPLVRSIADLTAANVSFDTSTGVATVAENLWEKSLEFTPGLTMEQCKLYHDHRTAFVAGLNQGIGEASLPSFQGSKELKAVTAVANILDDTAAVKIHRHKQYPVPGKDGETVNVYGGSEMNFSVRGAANVGQLKVSRQSLKSLFSVLAD